MELRIVRGSLHMAFVHNRVFFSKLDIYLFFFKVCICCLPKCRWREWQRAWQQGTTLCSFSSPWWQTRRPSYRLPPSLKIFLVLKRSECSSYKILSIQNTVDLKKKNNKKKTVDWKVVRLKKNSFTKNYYYYYYYWIYFGLWQQLVHFLFRGSLVPV